jgi:hypothetical protein
MQKHGRVVICCVAGVSHSNAIALGVLVKYFGMDFYDAWKLIRKRVPRANINPSHISKLKKLFNVTLAYQNTNFLFFLLCFENKHSLVFLIQKSVKRVGLLHLHITV